MDYALRREKKIKEWTARAANLGIEEKVSLASSELGTQTVTKVNYLPILTRENCPSTIDKSVVNYRNLEINLEIITCAEKFDRLDNPGSMTTQIYIKKPTLLPFFYRSKLVYASETPLKEPANTRVIALRDEQKWFFWLEQLYSKAHLEKALKDTDRKLTELTNFYSEGKQEKKASL